MNPDEFADSFGDEFAYAFLQMIRFHTGDFRKTAQRAYLLREQSEGSGQIFQVDEFPAVENSDHVVVLSAFQLKGGFGTDITGSREMFPHAFFRGG